MSYSIHDKNLIDVLCGEVRAIVRAETEALEKHYHKMKEEGAQIAFNPEFEHPLDEYILKEDGPLRNLLAGTEKMIPYSEADALDELWLTLLRKAILCLRYFDSREPFLRQGLRSITAYGLDQLENYHHRYTDFESLMYGASSYYRDHVFHAFRVWMLGAVCLLKRMVDGGTGAEGRMLIKDLELDGGAVLPDEINFFEYISIWTITALCHDLGYPLEKSDQILEKTRAMMRDFVPNPNIWNNFSYHGVQDSINEYILKFISTKMREKRDPQGNVVLDEAGKNLYEGRIQPKYYLKYAKSLENLQHGMISAIIIYKMLLYFLESDFNLNDDYTYTQEDARQFYIRREILRAISSHTCSDAYNMHLTTFSSLLFLCDEFQEWGRKAWNELYTGLHESSISLEIKCFSAKKVDVKETIDMKSVQNSDLVVENICRAFERQYSLYKTTFRDGQYTSMRDFDLQKTMNYELPDVSAETQRIEVRYELLASKASRFAVDLSESGDIARQRDYMSKIKKKLQGKMYSGDLCFPNMHEGDA